MCRDSPRLPDDGRTFEEFRVDDAFLKVWLPDRLLRAIDELCEYHSEIRSVMLRGFLFVHAYGNHTFEMMRCRHLGFYAPRPAAIPKYAVHGSDSTAHLGKSRNNLKLHLPARLRADLQTLAGQAGVPLSQYVREVLVSRILGHMQFPGRQEMLREIPPEQGEEDPDGGES